jgi:uncharacterized protein YceK
MRWLKLVGLMLALLASVGCGTLYNLDFNACCCGGRADSHRIYGGVEADVACAVKTLREMTAPDRPVSAQILYGTLVPILTLVDLPLSFTADTITLPWVIAAQLEKLKQTDTKQGNPEPPEPRSVSTKN